MRKRLARASQTVSKDRTVPIDSKRHVILQDGEARKTAERLSAAAYRALSVNPKRGNRGARGHYGADSEWYDSDAEEILIARLRQLERAGKIYNLVRQKRFDLHAEGGERVGFSKVDAAFWDVDLGRDRYQDAKGDSVRDTALSMWKFRHILKEHNIKVEIVRIKTGKRRRL